MKYALIFFVLLLLPAAVHAEIMRIDKRVCRYAVQHHPDASVAYQAGVGPHGRDVVPADINASPLNDMTKEIRIRITNDTAKVFDLQVPEIQKGTDAVPLARPEMEYYIVLKDGVPTLNGKPLEPPQERELLVLCQGKKARDKKH